MQEQEQKFRVIDYDQQLREEEDMLAREIQENLETVQLAAEQFNQHLHMQTETIETVDDNLDASDASLRAGLDQYTQSRKTAQSKHVSGGTGLGAGAGGALGAGAMAGVVGGPVGILVGGVIGAVFGGVGGRKLGKKLKDRGNKAITKEYIRHEERRAQVLATTRPAVSSKPTARGGLQEARGTEEEEGEEELDSEEADFQAWQRGEDQARPQVRYTGRTSSQRGQQGKPGVEQKEEEGEEETQDFTRFRRRRQNGRNLHSSSSSSSRHTTCEAKCTPAILLNPPRLLLTLLHPAPLLPLIMLHTGWQYLSHNRSRRTSKRKEKTNRNGEKKGQEENVMVTMKGEEQKQKTPTTATLILLTHKLLIPLPLTSAAQAAATTTPTTTPTSTAAAAALTAVTSSSPLMLAGAGAALPGSRSARRGPGSCTAVHVSGQTTCLLL
mmetsp:Transcript_6278/g.9771  ORF Transcript_6278/g.9771 Transcript_6278/m.9771 type:complete len:440 (-) Transcript_6278:31-1350(-)